MIRYAPAPTTWIIVAHALNRHPEAETRRDALRLFPGALCHIMPSASEALRRLLAQIEPKGTVLVPAFTCIRVADAVRAAGHCVTYADVDELSGVVTPESVAAAMAPDCRAVLVSHLFSSRVDVKGVVAVVGGRAAVIEDSALALWTGQSLIPGVMGLVFSFGRGKPIGIGSGGLCVVPPDVKIRTLDSRAVDLDVVGLWQVVARAVMGGRAALRFGRWANALIGVREPRSHPPFSELRPSGISTAAEKALKGLLDGVDVVHATRQCQDVVSLYRRAVSACANDTIRLLKETTGDALAEVLTPAMPLVVVNRDNCLRALRRAGFDIPVYWRYSVAEQGGAANCPVSERLARNLIFLPIHSGVTSQDVDDMLQIICRYSHR